MHEEIKKAIGEHAADLVHQGMHVGLGTGSTAFYFIQSLIEKCKKGLKVKALASSQRSYDQAIKGGIPMLDINQTTSLDIYVDGADEIDPLKRMIKGKGGALVKEKILASMSREMIVIVDQSKLVDHLGKDVLPVEIIPYAYGSTLHHLEKLGYKGTLRKKDDGNLYITENHNYIYDIAFSSPTLHPEKDHEMIRNIPGVVDTGFFFHLAGRVIVGFFDGQIVIRP
jgi:ribose 5-phosphate isomerase A